MIDFKSLIKAGVHFGHQKARWCPKMAPYIWGFKNNIHLIDISKTATQLEKAAQFLKDVAVSGKSILWVGTKKPAQDIIFSTANRLGQPYVSHRWIGGTLSNHSQVKKSITKLLHYEDIIKRSEKFPYYTKKELNTFQKMVDRLKKNIGGIRNLVWPLSAIIIVDVRKERAALREAVSVGVPVVALVDTNSDPTLVDYVIPSNDDAPRAIKLIIDYLADAIAQGQEIAAEKTLVKDTAKVEEDVAHIESDEEPEEEEEKASKGQRVKRVEEASSKKIVIRKLAGKVKEGNKSNIKKRGGHTRSPARPIKKK